MTTHTPISGIPVLCMRDTGRCGICELIDPESPRYKEDYRRLYHPEEFPEDDEKLQQIKENLKPIMRIPVPDNYNAKQGIPLAGDLATKAISTFGGDRIKRYIEKKLGRPCGCVERAERLNKLDRKIREYLSGRIG